MIHIVTAVHNRKEITVAFIKCIKSQTMKDVHLIVVDDGSTDGTAQAVVAEMPSATVIYGNGRLWWGGALQKAFLWIRDNLRDRPNDIIMFSNDDVAWGTDYLQKGIDALNAHDKTLIIGKGYGKQSGTLLDRVYIRDYTGSRGGNPKKSPLAVSRDGKGECCSTRSLFCRVKDVLDIGGFHTILLPHYGSDFEWTIRAGRKGYSILQMDNMTYYFDESTTGNHRYQGLGIRRVFSKKSAFNPIYRFSFIFLTTPKRYWRMEIYRQLCRYAVAVFGKTHEG